MEQEASISYTQQDATDRWNMVAEAWAQSCAANDPNRVYVLNPVLLELLGDVKDKRMLDAGCGEGYFSRKLALLGAKVTGIDLAKEMLRHAVD